MRVLHTSQLKVLLPIIALFLQRSRAIANLDPAGRVVLAKPGLLHVSQVFAFGNRTSPQGSILDCFQEALFATTFHSRPDQITHKVNFTLPKWKLLIA